MVDFEKYYQAALNDIFIVDESYSCLFLISKYVKSINAAVVGHLFGRLEDYFIDAMILAIGRLFDNCTDVLSIPSMIANSDKFRLRDKEGFLRELSKLGARQALIEIIEKDGLSSIAAERMKLMTPVKGKIAELKRVIDRRHKQVAHRDSSAKKFSPPMFSDVVFCNELAKRWVGCYAVGIRCTQLRDSKDRFTISQDAIGTSREIERVLQLLHVIEATNDYPKWMIDRFHEKNIARLKSYSGKV